VAESNSYMAIQCKDGKTIVSDKWLHINEETGQTEIISCNKMAESLCTS
jgi:hypothetical protein